MVTNMVPKLPYFENRGDFRSLCRGHNAISGLTNVSPQTATSSSTTWSEITARNQEGNQMVAFVAGTAISQNWIDNLELENQKNK